MMTIAVCISPSSVVMASGVPVGCSNSNPHTTCAIGIGESFSNCKSSIDCVSAKSLFGTCTTRKNTWSADSQATLSFGWKSVCQSLAIIPAGSPSVGRGATSRCIFPLPENCQSSRVSPVVWRMLQEFQRAILSPHPILRARVFNQGLQMLLGLGDAQDFLDGGASGFDLIPAV